MRARIRRGLVFVGGESTRLQPLSLDASLPTRSLDDGHRQNTSLVILRPVQRGLRHVSVARTGGFLPPRTIIVGGRGYHHPTIEVERETGTPFSPHSGAVA
jgi:hypothetical protein